MTNERVIKRFHQSKYLSKFCQEDICLCQEFEKQRSASEGEANLRIFLQMPLLSVGIFYFATRDKRCFSVSQILDSKYS